jgi:hypothetical protein
LPKKIPALGWDAVPSPKKNARMSCGVGKYSCGAGIVVTVGGAATAADDTGAVRARATVRAADGDGSSTIASLACPAFDAAGGVLVAAAAVSWGVAVAVGAVSDEESATAGTASEGCAPVGAVVELCAGLDSVCVSRGVLVVAAEDVAPIVWAELPPSTSAADDDASLLTELFVGAEEDCESVRAEAECDAEFDSLPATFVVEDVAELLADDAVEVELADGLVSLPPGDEWDAAEFEELDELEELEDPELDEPDDDPASSAAAVPICGPTREYPASAAPTPTDAAPSINQRRTAKSSQRRLVPRRGEPVGGAASSIADVRSLPRDILETPQEDAPRPY